LRGATVGLDTAPLIYFIERHSVYAPRLRPFFAAAERQEFQLLTSLVTLIEVLIIPLRTGRNDLVREYRDILLRSPSLKTVPLTVEIAEEAAPLRASHNVRTPDAIHLATARTGGASWFLTNDVGFPALPGISMLVLDRLPGQ
jgi:predicted nucleic acid-binding protein